jgi:hypothetical protein
MSNYHFNGSAPAFLMVGSRPLSDAELRHVRKELRRVNAQRSESDAIRFYHYYDEARRAWKWWFETRNYGESAARADTRLVEERILPASRR